MSNTFSWSEFLAGSGIAALIQAGIKYYQTKAAKKVNLSENTHDIALVHEMMEYVVDHTLFDRFMIFEGEDSAGVLSVGKRLYVTAHYEKFDRFNEKLESIKHLVQRWEADHQYYRMYSEMLGNEKVIIRTKEMPDSKLKNIYLTQDVKYSEIGHLMTTKDNGSVFYYILHHFMD